MSWHIAFVDTHKGLPTALLVQRERLEISAVLDTTDIEHGRVFTVRCGGDKVRLLRRNNGLWYIEGSGDYGFD